MLVDKIDFHPLHICNRISVARQLLSKSVVCYTIEDMNIATEQSKPNKQCMYKVKFVNREEEKDIGHICNTVKDVREMTVDQNRKKRRDERNAKRTGY